MEAVAVVATGLVFATSGWLQAFYDDPRYAQVMRWMCVNFFIMPYMTINGSLLRRRMDYKTVSQVNIAAGILAPCTSIGTAMLGWGPYSLVTGGITAALSSTLLMARKAPWRPHIHFSWTGLLPLLTKAWRFHLNATLNRVASRVDNIFVGKLVGLNSLGLYTKAFSLARLPLEQVTIRVYQIIFTGLSRIQNDRDRTLSVYQKALCALSSITFPLLLLMVLVGEGLVVNLYGEKWAGAVVPMQLMAIGAFASVLSVTLGALADAQGLMARETPIEALNIAMTIVAVLVGSRWGLPGVATGIAVKATAMLLLMQRLLATSSLALGWRTLVEPVWPAVLSTVVGAGGGVLCMHALGDHYTARDLWFMVAVIAAAACAYAVTWAMCARWARHNKPLQTMAGLAWGVVRRIPGLRRAGRVETDPA
jgi:O-antigen/teichoic acid export membrane protein